MLDLTVSRHPSGPGVILSETLCKSVDMPGAAPQTTVVGLPDAAFLNTPLGVVRDPIHTVCDQGADVLLL